MSKIGYLYIGSILFLWTMGIFSPLFIPESIWKPVGGLTFIGGVGGAILLILFGLIISGLSTGSGTEPPQEQRFCIAGPGARDVKGERPTTIETTSGRQISLTQVCEGMALLVNEKLQAHRPAKYEADGSFAPGTLWTIWLVHRGQGGHAQRVSPDKDNLDRLRVVLERERKGLDLALQDLSYFGRIVDRVKTTSGDKIALTEVRGGMFYRISRSPESALKHATWWGLSPIFDGSPKSRNWQQWVPQPGEDWRIRTVWKESEDKEDDYYYHFMSITMERQGVSFHLDLRCLPLYGRIVDRTIETTSGREVPLLDLRPGCRYRVHGSRVAGESLADKENLPGPGEELVIRKIYRDPAVPVTPSEDNIQKLTAEAEGDGRTYQLKFSVLPKYGKIVEGAIEEVSGGKVPLAKLAPGALYRFYNSPRAGDAEDFRSDGETVPSEEDWQVHKFYRKCGKTQVSATPQLHNIHELVVELRRDQKACSVPLVSLPEYGKIVDRTIDTTSGGKIPLADVREGWKCRITRSPVADEPLEYMGQCYSGEPDLGEIWNISDIRYLERTKSKDSTIPTEDNLDLLWTTIEKNGKTYSFSLCSLPRYAEVVDEE